jgi:microfibrillar-associated protein 1
MLLEFVRFPSRPVRYLIFVCRQDRETIEERDKRIAEEEALEEERLKQLEERKIDSERLVKAEVEREREAIARALEGKRVLE